MNENHFNRRKVRLIRPFDVSDLGIAVAKGSGSPGSYRSGCRVAGRSCLYFQGRLYFETSMIWSHPKKRSRCPCRLRGYRFGRSDNPFSTFRRDRNCSALLQVFAQFILPRYRSSPSRRRGHSLRRPELPCASKREYGQGRRENSRVILRRRRGRSS